MADKSTSERLGIVEVEVVHLKKDFADFVAARAARAAREWTLIMAVVSVLVAFIANKLGLIG